MLQAAFLILALPLAGFVLLAIFGRRLGDPAAGYLGALAIAAAFVSALVTWAGLLALPSASRQYQQHLFGWFSAGSLKVPVALLVDPLSMTMALFVTGVATLIHLYSVGYMRGDPQYSKFFVYLNLFVFSMLTLVLSNNLVLTFLGWEGVGACSYWLISFWFHRPSAASAGKKAFIYNRVGDVGFLVAMFLIFDKTHTLNYTAIFAALHGGMLSGPVVTVALLLLFLGAVGKSAQIPLYPWLVDAMEGPTPVSALIHAATMVTAGVYLMTRMSPLLAVSQTASVVVASVGVITAFVAAAAACAQQDIKRVLAYSTVSQLGYMFLAVGAHAYVAAIFLMVAHAFYKALLFLGAGSVIHGMHDEQDIKRMGGLRRYMPVTAATFVVAWLAIGGVPPLAGFWAKGDVLLNAWADARWMWAVGLLTALLTAYYIGRETVLVFYGPERWRSLGPTSASDRSDAHGNASSDPHEAPAVMTLPLVVLAAASVLGGLLNLPFSGMDVLTHWLSPVVTAPRILSLGVSARWTLEAADAVVALLGVALAVGLWRKRSDRQALEPHWLLAGWGLDEAMDRIFARSGTRLAAVAADGDTRVIDGAVMGVARAVRYGGARLRLLQSGYVRNYALGIALGTVVILGYIVSRAAL